DGAGGTCISPVTPLPPTDCPPVAGGPLGEASHPDEGATHVVVCSTTCYQSVPPSSGTHYPVWPVYKAYDQPVPWGFLVHGLQHGSIIGGYNCPCRCTDEVAAGKRGMAAPPAETSGGRRPALIPPAPPP